jgi:hypothetical protein
MGDHVREGGHFADVSVQFVGVFTKLQKATISFVILSVHMEQLCSHWTDFHEI